MLLLQLESLIHLCLIIIDILKSSRDHHGRQNSRLGQQNPFQATSFSCYLPLIVFFSNLFPLKHLMAMFD